MRRRTKAVLAALAFAVVAATFGGAVAWRGASAVEPPPLAAATADYIVVEKAARKLLLYKDGALVRSYEGIAFGADPVGHKRREGDERTPEGLYKIDRKNPRSAFHLSLRISYPDAADRADAAARGEPPGGDIFIHGQPNAIKEPDFRLPGDWTDGCIALSNSEIEEIWSLVPVGTPIEIRP